MRKLVSIVAAATIIVIVLAARGLVGTPGIVTAQEVAVVPSQQEQPVAAAETTPQTSSTASVSVTSAHREAADGRWGIERINVPAAWDAAGSFAPVLVAVIDTGIDPSAPFADRIKAGIDFSGSGTLNDEHGHGTHMAGTIAAIAPNASFVNLKVADKRGRCESDTVAKAIRWAADRGAQVINVSLEVAPTHALETAVEHACDKGALVIAAAGNSGSSSPAYPAAYMDAVAVAGTNQEDGLAVLSNHGTWVDIAAPGLKVYSELPGGEYGLETGTSPAAAHVSGVAALALGVAWDTNGDGHIDDEVRYALETFAEPLAQTGTGSGIVNALGTIHYLNCLPQ